MSINDLDPSKPSPVDPEAQAELRDLAELVIADAVLHCLGDHIDLDADEHDALECDIEAEVDAMFAEPEWAGFTTERSEIPDEPNWKARNVHPVKP